jgi:hypothetical protein
MTQPRETEVSAVVLKPLEPAAVVSPLVTAEQAQRITQSIEALEENLLRERDYVWWARWKEGGRSKRKGFDDRIDAEGLAALKNGVIERTKRKSGYQRLATFMGISTEFIEEQLHWCLAHAGAHPVYKMTVKAIAPNGRYAIGTAAVATCERLNQEGTALWGREEHDPRAMAETRAYIRAMQTLIGFGEAEPVAPAGRQARRAAPGSRSPAQPSQPPASGIADWSTFWAQAKDLGLDKVEVHSTFRVSTADGALAAYAQARAERERKPIKVVIAEMADELKSHPSSKQAPQEGSFQQRLEGAGPAEEPVGEEEEEPPIE